MFASRLRPIARTAARRAYATASSASSTASARVAPKAKVAREGEGLAYVVAASAALFATSSAVYHLRVNNSSGVPKTDDEEEEEAEEEAEAEEEQAVEAPKQTATDAKAETLIEAAIAGLSATAEEVDDALAELVTATEAALAKYASDKQTAAVEAATLPDPAEAASQGAFNEETGEINWDCPCLGGMAHGPCGEQFKAAFSCFVYSEAEPKGLDCVEKFQAMQDCFREHPEVYGEEIDDDEAPAPAAEEPKEAEKEATA